MGFRDRLRKGLDDGLRGLVKRAEDWYKAGQEIQDEVQGTQTERTEVFTQEPEPELKTETGGNDEPPVNNDSLYPGTADNPGDLEQQIADLSIQLNELVRMADAAGKGDDVRQIVSGFAPQAFNASDVDTLSIASNLAVEQALQAMQKAIDAANDSGNKLTANAKRMLSEAEKQAESARQAAKDAQEFADELQKKADEMEELMGIPPEVREAREYKWRRSSVHIAFQKPRKAFEKMDEEWTHIAFGVKRDENGDPIGKSRFVPYAIVRGSEFDPGRYIPYEALVNATAFENWAQRQGLKDGLSIEITSVMPKPGESLLRR